MKNPSDQWEELSRKILGLGDTSVRKTHYTSLGSVWRSWSGYAQSCSKARRIYWKHSD